MKILLLAGNFHPEKTGIGVTATDCARFLTKLGHRVTAITTMPYYPEWEIHPEYRNRWFSTEQLEGIEVKRSWLFVPKKPSAINRIANELSIALLAFARSWSVSFDRVVCVSPPLTLGVAAAAVSLIRRRPMWCYIKDIQPDAAVTLGMLKNKLVIRVSRWMEALIYRQSEKILVLSGGMKRNLEQKGVPSAKITVLPDAVDISELSIPAAEKSRSNFRTKYGLESMFLVLHSGNLGVKQNPEVIVESAKRLREHSAIFFAIVGDGAMREQIKRRIEDYQLDNIQLYPLCERAELPDMLASADVLLLTQRSEVVDAVVPSKLLTYLCSGTAVLAAVHPASEAASYLNNAAAARIVDAENADQLSDAVLYLQAHRSEADAIGIRGKQLVAQTFDYPIIFALCSLFGRAEAVAVPAAVRETDQEGQRP